MSREALRVDVRTRQVAVLFGGSIAACVVFAPPRDLVGVSALFIGLVIILSLAWRHPPVRGPLLVAFTIRALAALTHAYVVELPGAGLDAVNFEIIGWQWSQNDWQGLRHALTGGSLLYPWFIAILYWITTRSPLMIQMVNVLLGSLVVFEVYRLAALLWSVDRARRAAWIAAVWPTMVLYSAITLREMAVAYPLMVGAVWLVKWRSTDRPKWLAGTLGAFVIGISFHTMMLGALAFVLASAGGRWLQTLRHGPVRSSLPLFIGLVVAALAVAAVFRGGLGAGDYAYADVLLSSDLITSQQVGTGDRASYLQGLVMRTPLDVLWQLPIRTLFFLFMPFPWLVTALVDLQGLLDSLLYMGLAVAAYRGRRELWTNPLARTTMLLWITCAVVFGVVVTNYGTAIRHRGKLAPLLIAVAVAGLPKTRTKGASADDFARA